jgi:hypothetical protein
MPSSIGLNHAHNLSQTALSWLCGRLETRSFVMDPRRSSASVTTAPERIRATIDHARIRVMTRVGRMRPILRTDEPVSLATARSDELQADNDADAAAAAALEARGLPAGHMHFAVERALRRLGVAARADMTAHRGELFPDLFLLPLPPQPHRAHHPHHPHHRTHHHHHHAHSAGGIGAGGVIVQALDEGCFVPGTQMPTDYVLVKQVRLAPCTPHSPALPPPIIFLQSKASVLRSLLPSAPDHL